MFQELIRETPFTTEAANSFFTNISGETWSGDSTFLSTMRALLATRISDDNEIFLRFRRYSYSLQDLANLSSRDAVRIVAGDAGNHQNTLLVINICNNSNEANDAWIEAMKEHFTSVYKDFAFLEKVTVFFRKVCNTACFVNAKSKTSVLFVSQMTARRMHYIQSGVLAYLPWYFDPSKGITEDEKALMNSLREKSPSTYNSLLSRMAQLFDFETARVRKLLTGFETKYERLRLERTRRALDSKRDDILRLNRQIAQCLNEMRDFETVVLGLETKISNGEESNDLMDYFIANKRLILKSVDGTIVEFVVKAPLTYFDEEQAKKYLDRRDSYFYSCLDNSRGFTRENIRMLMEEIFIKQRLKVNFCAAYRFQLEGNVEPLRAYDNYGGQCSEYTPNPHIDRYRCIGSYESLINERLAEHDYIGALEQCVASCKSLNLGDSAVMREFVQRFCYNGDVGVNMHCVVLPDNKVVTPKEAIAWLLEEKRAKQAECEDAAAAEATPAEAAE